MPLPFLQIRDFLNTLNDTIASAPVTQLDANQQLHHIGIYGHHCGLWSTAVATISPLTGPYHITALPKQTLELAMLDLAQQPILNTYLQSSNNNSAALISNLQGLCELLNELPLFPLPGTHGILWSFSIPLQTSTPDTNGIILLFDPLRDLQLLDIAPVKADSFHTTR